MKKGYGWLAPAVVSVAMLTGCTGNGGSESSVKPSASPGASAGAQANDKINLSGFPIAKSNIQMSIMMKKAPNQSAWDSLWIAKHLDEKLGGKTVAVEVDEGAWNEKKNLAFATGELPDMIWTNGALTPSDITNYGVQGLLVPLNDLIDKYAPNIKKILEQNPDLRKTVTSLDGKIYALAAPAYPKREPVIGRYWLNTQWMSKLGLKTPTTLDEFYNVLKAFKEQDPNGNGKADEIPASGASASNPIDSIVLTAVGYLEKYITLDKTGKKVVYAQAQPEYKEYLTFMNKLYKDGLLDSEYYTQNITTFRGKAQKDQVGFYFDAAHFVAVGLDKYTNYASFPPLTSAQNPTKIWPLQRVATIGGMNTIAITSKNKNPEASIRLIDYAFTEEGGGAVRFGPKLDTVVQGAGIVNNSDGTWEIKTPQGVSSNDYRMKSITNLSLPAPDAFYLKNKEVPEQASLTKNLVENMLPYGKPVYPNVFLTKEEQEKVNKIQTDLKTYVDQMEAKFVVGDTPITKWDEYIATVQKIGVNDLIAIYQTAFDRWNK
ncbi:extracellular solute-binding protein [Paenibacillus koleovorans]|uniref:extracellular solute-binding protein n=1 Tax=Paenibacillus koleovorans TaxID=121608 RepID=UPI0013E367BC|nr:extracellular solute-binding protein [Paenibacillus koleovorans]